MNKPTLLDIADDARALAELLDELDGEITGQEEAVQAFFDETGEALTAKVDAYAGLIRQHEAYAAARKAEAKRMADLAKTDENRAKWLKERLLLALDIAGVSRVEGDRHRVTVAKNGGKQALEVDDENALAVYDDGRFSVMVRELDKDAVRDALGAGEDVPGARFRERGRSVRIK